MKLCQLDSNLKGAQGLQENVCKIEHKMGQVGHFFLECKHRKVSPRRGGWNEMAFHKDLIYLFPVGTGPFIKCFLNIGYQGCLNLIIQSTLYVQKIMFIQG